MFNFINNTKCSPMNTKSSYNIHQTQLKRGNPPPPEMGSKTVSLFSQPYLDTYTKCYKNIVVVNLKPQGPLGDLVRFVTFPKLSQFQEYSSCNHIKQCGYALTSLDSCHCGDLMVVDEIPNLISYLVSNDYKVDTSITKMFNQSEIRFDTNTGNKLICFVTYNG